MTSCTKKNEPEKKPYTDDIYGVKIRYVLSIVAAENSLTKDDSISIRNAEVTIVQNDSIVTKQVNERGMIYFENLFAGNTIVNIKCEGYSTANLIVNLALTDTTMIDSGNMRIISTIVTLFPTEGESLAKITGKLLANTDTTTIENEILTNQVKIFSIISNDEFFKFIDHSISGGILNLNYENITKTTTSNNSGNYEIFVPAALSGLKSYIYANELEISSKYYYLPKDSVKSYPFQTIYKDLVFIEK